MTNCKNANTHGINNGEGIADLTDEGPQENQNFRLLYKKDRK